MATLCREGTLRERAAALIALAGVASPSFDQCLASLVDVEDPYCLRDACQAIQEMGGDHPGAHEILTRALLSLDPEVIEAGQRALVQTTIKLPFGTLWNSERHPVLWAGLVESMSVPMAWITGVAAVHPWRDPAWPRIPARVQQAILARAGSTEALARLVRLTRENPEIARGPFLRDWPAEKTALADLPGLRRLLASESSALQAYAAESLATFDDPELIREFLRSGQETLVSAAARGITLSRHATLAQELCLEGQSPEVRSLCEGSHLALLPDSALLQLLDRDAVTWLRAVQHELLNRGRPLSLGQVMGRAPLPNGATLAPPEPLPRSWLWVSIGCVLREGDAGRFTELVEEAVDSPDSSGYDVIWSLLDEVRRRPSFVRGMPTGLLEKNRKMLWRWYHQREVSESPSRPEVERWVRRIAGLALFDPQPLRKPLWSAWLAETDPLVDWQQMAFLISGTDGYASALRTGLGECSRERWLPDLARIVASTILSIDGSSSWYWPWRCVPYHLPVEATWTQTLPPRVRVIRNNLVSDLRDGYLYSPSGRLSADFLVYRLGTSILNRGYLEDLVEEDPRECVRAHARAVLRGICEGCQGPDIPQVEPASQEALNRLRGVLSNTRIAFFGNVVKEYHEPRRAPIYDSPVIGAGRDTPPKTAGFLLSRCSTDLLPQIRGLLDSDDGSLRREAELAVWEMTRDSAIPDRWAREIERAPGNERASLLELLTKAHRPTDIGQIASLLTSSDPELRLLALDGVRNYHQIELLAEVIDAITDPEPIVARKALSALGSWAIPETVPLLLRLSTIEDRNLADAAFDALRNFHRADVIDLLVERLVAYQKEGRPIRRLMAAADGAVLGLERGDLPHYVSEADGSDVDALAAWWSEVNRGGEYGWIRPAFDRLVRILQNASQEQVDQAGFAVLGRKWGSSSYRKQEYPLLVGWLNVLPADDLWHIRMRFWGAPFVTGPNLARIDERRVMRQALEELVNSIHWQSQQDSSRAILMMATGRDCGSFRHTTCAAGVAVNRCWYDLGLELGVWP